MDIVSAAAIAAWLARASSAATIAVLIRRDVRESRAQAASARRERLHDDDKEADRLIGLKDKTISELSSRLDIVEGRVRALEAKLDMHGCLNAPTCVTRRPLHGPGVRTI